MVGIGRGAGEGAGGKGRGGLGGAGGASSKGWRGGERPGIGGRSAKTTFSRRGERLSQAPGKLRRDRGEGSGVTESVELVSVVRLLVWGLSSTADEDPDGLLRGEGTGNRDNACWEKTAARVLARESGVGTLINDDVACRVKPMENPPFAAIEEDVWK